MAASLSPVLHPFPWIDCVIIFGLVALNGVFAMSELAIVSARRPRLDAMARKGSKGAARAMALGADPGRFLSTVQIGITLIGIIAGAYSGASLGGPTGERLAVLGVREDWAETLGFAIVIGITTFVSLVIGELVPKQFALRAPEPIAAVMALPMQWLARITAPFVWLLDNTSALIFRILRLKRETQSHVTAEELHLIVAEASKSGVIEESERAIISGVVRLADRPVREVMTPRTEVAWVDVDASPQALRDAILESGHSRMLIAEGSVDKVIGVVQSRDIVAALLNRKPLDMRALMRTAPILPDQVDAMDALGVLRGAEVPMALVHDEYGHFEGIVTPADILEAITGVFRADLEEGEPTMVYREDGSMLLAGYMPADEMADHLGINLPESRDYETLAGYLLSLLHHLPATGETVDAQGWRFEVVDLDGRRIDKVIASRLPGTRREAAR